MLDEFRIMRYKFHQFSAVALAFALLSGCAGSSDQYPSLAIRDAERAVGQFTPTQANDEAPPTRAPASAQDIAQLVEQASESHKAFLSAQSSAGRLVSGARGTSTESDARARALVALADLTSKRSDTAIALGDIDLLAAQGKTEFSTSGDLEAAQTLIADIVDQQDRALAALWGQLER